MNKILFSLLIIISFFSCKKSDDLKPLDLNSYGIPISILAPDSTDVIVKDLVVMKDVVIRQGDGSKFNIQLYMSDATTTDKKSVISDYKSDQEGNVFFAEMVKDEENGFIFKSRIDSTTTSFGFKYVRIENNKEYLFQNGLYGIYTLEQIEKMYRSVEKLK